LVVESAPGCSDSLKYNNVIHVADYPHADFTYGPDEPGNGEEVFFFNHSTGDDITDYTWNFGDGHSSHVQDPTHTYHLTESDLMTVHLTVTNSDGCADDTIVTVPVEDHFAFFVPSSFTPNNDGKNEIFLPRVNDVVDYEFTIFARTGELIFQTNSPEMGWDGTIQGKPAPEGIYVWKIHYAKIGTPEEKMMKTGTVTLIR
jgi:gliding motility-associated-like protein